jgi:hypothetical protein
MEGRNKFTLNGKRGFILSSSFEEAGRPVEATIKQRRGYELLVFASQGWKLKQIHAALKKASFPVKEFSVQRIQGLTDAQIELKANRKAKEILAYFNSN